MFNKIKPLFLSAFKLFRKPQTSIENSNIKQNKKLEAGDRRKANLFSKKVDFVQSIETNNGNVIGRVSGITNDFSNNNRQL